VSGVGALIKGAVDNASQQRLGEVRIKGRRLGVAIDCDVRARELSLAKDADNWC